MAKIEQVAMTKKLPATTLKLIFIASIKFMGVKNKSGATKMVYIIHKNPGIINGFR